MAITTLPVRQFFNVPTEEGAFAAPASTFVVTGSVSRLLVNDSRTNLANDSFTINSTTYNSDTTDGWWPSPSIDGGSGYGIIVGGNDLFSNTSPDGRISTVSCWGWVAQEDQANNDAEFIALAAIVTGVEIATTASAKTNLQSRGYYYQYPTGFDGQSPKTGAGSDA